MILKRKDAPKKEATMFGKEGEGMTVEGKMNSIIGKGCKFNGTVEVQEGTLRIDGEFEGDITCPDTLVIGKDGKVKAEIKVKNAVIGGTVTGNIDAKDKIELQAGSHVQGDIKTSRLVIDEGVFFEGACRMSPEGKGDMPKPYGGTKVPDEKKEPVQSGMK